MRETEPRREYVDVSDKSVIDMLKEKGLEDSESLALLDSWTTERQAELDKRFTQQGHVDMEIRRAKIYRDAGYEQHAREAFTDAIDLANNYNLSQEYIEKLRQEKKNSSA